MGLIDLSVLFDQNFDPADWMLTRKQKQIVTYIRDHPGEVCYLQKNIFDPSVDVNALRRDHFTAIADKIFILLFFLQNRFKKQLFNSEYIFKNIQNYVII